jgi:hypothetical protein
LAKYGLLDIIDRSGDGYVNFTFDDNNGKWACSIIHDDNAEYNPMSESNISIVPIMVGDYKFYLQMLGKEGYDSHWCPHCKLIRTDWQAGCNYVIENWELETIKAQHQSNIATKAEGIAMKGVKEDPYFEIPVSNYIPGMLHLKLGEVNKVVDYINDFADRKVQPVSHQQHQLRQDVIQLETNIQLAMEEKKYWDSDHDDAGKEIVKKAKTLLKQLDKQIDPSEDERASIELQIETEIVRKKELQSSLNVMRKAKRTKVDELARFALGRKTEEDSLVTGIDNIFQAYHIFRAQYHGGDLAGGHLS